MPNFFITLSCAECFWPDAAHLLNERLAIEGHPDAVSAKQSHIWTLVLDLLVGCQW